MNVEDEQHQAHCPFPRLAGGRRGSLRVGARPRGPPRDDEPPPTARVPFPHLVAPPPPTPSCLLRTRRRWRGRALSRGDPLSRGGGLIMWPKSSGKGLRRRRRTRIVVLYASKDWRLMELVVSQLRAL